ncbi:hypothetical protein M9H77_03531 [Catharanthus roseus]|uniref:Uncharacterized protein n=1 Tax=Catharanthus roseus TaxID=4058 RepID=A0ACC0CC13_CATRO|nr:hypothetical protein M9H77_03531 [Catharanthus roseus]
MYRRTVPEVMGISCEFQLGVKCFINWCLNYGLGTANELRCPCAKCKNKRIDVDFQDTGTLVHMSGELESILRGSRKKRTNPEMSTNLVATSTPPGTSAHLTPTSTPLGTSTSPPATSTPPSGIYFYLFFFFCICYRDVIEPAPSSSTPPSAQGVVNARVLITPAANRKVSMGPDT